MTRRVALILAALSLLACRKRNRGDNATSTTVATELPAVAPPPVPPPLPAADGGVAAPVVPTNSPVADAAVAVVPPSPSPSRPSPAPPRAGEPGAAPLLLPSPIEGVPGVRVRRGRRSTGVNIGGVQINLPTQ